MIMMMMMMMMMMMRLKNGFTEMSGSGLKMGACMSRGRRCRLN